MSADAKANPKPPAPRRAILLRWVSKLPGEPPAWTTVNLSPGWEIGEQFRDLYLDLHEMHLGTAERCRANGWSLPTQSAICVQGELVGCCEYDSEDPHDRALSDSAIREIEWEFRGRGPVPEFWVCIDPDIRTPSEMKFEKVIEEARRVYQKAKETEMSTPTRSLTPELAEARRQREEAEALSATDVDHLVSHYRQLVAKKKPKVALRLVTPTQTKGPTDEQA